MTSTNSHMRPVARVHLDYEQNMHLDRPDHEPDLDAIIEEGGEPLSTSSRQTAFDSCGGSDLSFTSLSDIIDGLPTAVKSSLGPLRTIRRSASISGWVSYFYEISTSSKGTHISHEERAEEHHHTLVSTTTTEVALQEQHQRPMNSNQKRRRTLNTTPMRDAKDHMPSNELVEFVEQERKGIDRFCGMQGQLLVNNALSEQRSSFNQDVRTDGSGGDHSNERRAYVQGLAWLLQGLPHELDDQERTELRRAMPPYLVGDMDYGGGRTRRLGPSLRSGTAAEHGHRSFLRRLIAALILQLVVPMQFAWAYLIAMLGYAVYLERKYCVAELVVKHAGEVGYAMGKNGVRLSGVIYNHGGARVGSVLTGAAAYVADGVRKGVSDGIREAYLELSEDRDREGQYS